MVGATTGRNWTLPVPSTPGHLGCRMVAERGSGRRVERGKSLQMSGSAYGIRTRVTAVRGRPEGLSDRDQRSASGHGKSQELWPFAAKIRACLLYTSPSPRD